VGRGADVDLGDRDGMHRRVAALAAVGGRWFLGNLLPGKRLTMTPRGTGGGPVAVAAGEDEPIPVGSSRVSFRIGPDLAWFDVEAPTPSERLGTVVPPASAATATDLVGLEVSLTPALKLLAVAMAELQLLDRRSTTIPTRSEVCARLAWSDKQYERNLDRLCEVLAGAGVRGVIKEGDTPALQRQAVAVEALLDNAELTYDDLALLPSD
jgi:hypothetical protein